MAVSAYLVKVLVVRAAQQIPARLLQWVLRAVVVVAEVEAAPIQVTVAVHLEDLVDYMVAVAVAEVRQLRAHLHHRTAESAVVVVR